MRALIALLVFLATAGQAYAMGGVNPSCMVPLHGQSEPAPAVSNGFNCARISENFGSADSIDINNTGAIKYTWKAETDPSTNVLNPSDLSFNNPGITLWNTHNGEFPGIFSAASPASNGVMIGKTFPNGGYFEAKIQADPTLSKNAFRTCSPGCSWPDFVFTLYNIFNQNSCPPGTEIDNFEYLPNTTDGSIIPATAIDQFTTTPSCTSSIFSSGSRPTITIDANPHAFGRLWLTAAQNGGSTGVFEVYVDGVHLTTQCGGGTCDTTYTVGANFGQAEGTNQNIEMVGGPGFFTNTVSWVQAWTR